MKVDMSVDMVRSGYLFAFGVLKAIGIVALIALVANLVFAYFVQEVDDSDADRWNRSGFVIRTDALTGCQYLQNSGAIVQRMNSEGKQVGCVK